MTCEYDVHAPNATVVGGTAAGNWRLVATSTAGTTSTWASWAIADATSTASTAFYFNQWVEGIQIVLADELERRGLGADELPGGWPEPVRQARALYNRRVRDTDPIAPAERERILERQREHEAAGAAAEALLREHLSPDQLLTYDELGSFLVTAPSGRTYQIRQGIAGNVDVIEDNRIVGQYCIHPADLSVPAQDNMLAQKLWLEHDEETFRRVGNFTAARVPVALT
jgi:hypothetical protein